VHGFHDLGVPCALPRRKDVGRTVCACFNVGVNTILVAIETQQLISVEQIGELLKADTNCGSCVPELKTLLGDSRKSA
jgi:assimilatory nitrate reductase catalytic subunit